MKMKSCNHCGKCCRGSPCGLAERYGYYVEPGKPCPALRRVGTKYLCGLVLDARTEEERKLLMDELKIGWGCHLWPQRPPVDSRREDDARGNPQSCDPTKGC